MKASTTTEMHVLIEEQRIANRLLAVMAVKGMEQPKAIAFLDSVGLEPKQIAAAIGVTRNAVSIALHRMRKVDARAPEIADGSQETLNGLA